MGVDFFPCHYCGESICDCGDYVYCSCYRKWCDDNCAKAEGYIDDPTDDNVDGSDTCNFCRKQDAEDSDLLKFILEVHGWTREEVVRHYYGDKI